MDLKQGMRLTAMYLLMLATARLNVDGTDFDLDTCMQVLTTSSNH